MAVACDMHYQYRVQCSEPNVPRLMVGSTGSLRLRSPRQLADNLRFRLFALHCGIYALLVPWHVGEGASAYLGNVIRVVCCDDESILHYDAP
jgi:hypothetical protein